LKEAVLLHHTSDALWAKEKFGNAVELIAHDDWIRWAINAPDMTHIFPPSNGSSKVEEEVKHLVLNWHRDENGKDLAFKKGISWGQVISGSAWITIPSFYREYYSLKKCLERFNCVYISKNENPRFLAIASKFSKQIRIFDPGHTHRSILSSCNDRILGKFPSFSRKDSILRFVNRPFRSFLKERDLFFNDWTLSIFANRCKNALLISGRNPLKGAYFSNGNRQKAELLCPKELDASFHPESLEQTLKGIGAEWDFSLLELISDHLSKSYQSNRNYFISVIAIYQQLYEDYRPKRVIIPGEIYEPYTIALQLARLNGIETVLVGDGYASVAPPGMAPTYMNENGDGWLFDKFAAYGQASWDHLKQKNVPDADLILMRPPLLHRHKNLPKPNEKYDAMIMSWISNDLNPQGFNGWRIRCVLETLEVLRKLGYKDIALKLKADNERTIFEPILKQYGWLDNVTILTGMFYEHVLKANRIIGGLSTGVLEATFHGIPYYVYEPFENGYSDRVIHSSRVVGASLISRTTDQLLKHLANDVGSVNQPLGYLFEGPDLRTWN
jgi:hypothetical protein